MVFSEWVGVRVSLGFGLNSPEGAGFAGGGVGLGGKACERAGGGEGRGERPTGELFAKRIFAE